MTYMKRAPWPLFFIFILIIAFIFFSLSGAAGAQLATITPASYLPLILNMATDTPTPTPTLTPTPTFTPTPLPPGPSSPPAFSTSLYMDSIDPQVAFDLGCALGDADLKNPGKQISLVVLDYGTPKFRNGYLGVSAMWRTGFVSMPYVVKSAEYFGWGYWNCVGSDFDSHLTIAIGVNNYYKDVDYPSVNADHGRAWAQVTNDVNYWFQEAWKTDPTNSCPRGCDGQVDALGATDIELAWNYTNTNPAAQTIDWVSGYLSGTTTWLVNFGALEGCPTLANPGAKCAGGWTKDQIMQVTTGNIKPLPEVYATSGVNAQQWYLMSLYAYLNPNIGMPFDFIGTMTTYQACVQYPSGCTGINNYPTVGWQQLYNLINGDSRTYDNLTYSTDIKWLNKGTSAPVLYSLSSLKDPQAAQKLEALPAEQPVEIQEGIYEGSGGLLRPWEADIRNTWEGFRGGQPLRILAGAPVDDANAGLVLIIDPVTAGEQAGLHGYTASGSGPLRIVSVKDTQVFLQKEDGTAVIFDLVKRTFTSFSLFP
jgi:hypothetical protein